MEIEDTENSVIANRRKMKIKNRILIQRKMLKNLINIIFPGAGYLLKDRERVSIIHYVQIFFTSCIYALYGALYFFSFSYPFSIQRDCVFLMFAGAGLYSFVFIIYYLRKLFIELHPVEGTIVTFT